MRDAALAWATEHGPDAVAALHKAMMPLHERFESGVETQVEFFFAAPGINVKEWHGISVQLGTIVVHRDTTYPYRPWISDHGGYRQETFHIFPWSESDKTWKGFTFGPQWVFYAKDGFFGGYTKKMPTLWGIDKMQALSKGWF